MSAILTILLLPFLALFLDEPIIENGTFEKASGKVPRDWMQVYPRNLATEAPEFLLSKETKKEGKYSGVIRVLYEGGYTSFTQ